MDASRRLAITSCGNCGMSEEDHKSRREDAEALAVLGALGGACSHFTASDASLGYVQHLGIAARDPQRRADGRRGRRGPLCKRCGQRGHRKEDCPL